MPENEELRSTDVGELPPKSGRLAQLVVAFVSGLLLVSLMIAASMNVNYSFATRLWLLLGILLAGTVISAALYYAHLSNEASDAAAAAYKSANRRLAASYARLSDLKATLSEAIKKGDDPAATVQAQAAADQAEVALSHATSLYRDTDADRQVVSATIIMDTVVFLVLGLVTVSFWSAADRSTWAASIVWSLACVLMGGFSGFLFGIPRFRSEGRTPQTSTTLGGAGSVAVAQSPSKSTNDQSPIEQIADWLTKTIVGVALVNLKDLPSQLHRWASVIARGISTEYCDRKRGDVVAIVCQADSFAMALIAYFTILGFLAGYLITQFFLQSYVNQTRT